jgi:hypothetical protein
MENFGPIGQISSFFIFLFYKETNLYMVQVGSENIYTKDVLKFPFILF